MPSTKKHILLVDDDKMAVSAEQQMLERYFDYKVTTLTSSTTALQVFRANPYRFDLVITDMIMPKMTGELLAIELREVRPDIPIIFCSGYSEKVIKKTAKEIRGAYLTKPFDVYEMGRTIWNVLH